MSNQKKTRIIIIVVVVLFILSGLIKTQLKGRFGYGVLGDTPSEAFEKSSVGDDRDIREDITVIDLGNHGIMYVAGTTDNEVLLIHMNKKNGKYYVDCAGNKLLAEYSFGYYGYGSNTINSLEDISEIKMEFNTGTFWGYISYSENFDNIKDIDMSKYEICTFMSPENDPNRREVTIAWRIEEYPDK